MAYIYLVAAGSWLIRHRHPAWSMWLLLWFIMQVTWNPHSPAWVRGGWIWAGVPAAMLLSLSMLEAYFEALPTHPLAVRLSIGLGTISLPYVVWMYRVDYSSLVAEVLSYLLVVRIWTAVFAIGAVVFLACAGEHRMTIRQSLHLMTVSTFAVTFAVGSVAMEVSRRISDGIMLRGLSGADWAHLDLEIRQIRLACLLVWILFVPEWPACDAVTRWTSSRWRSASGWMRSAGQCVLAGSECSRRGRHTPRYRS